jgi:hypothetical protein
MHATALERIPSRKNRSSKLMSPTGQPPIARMDCRNDPMVASTADGS